MGLHNRKTAKITGEICLDGEELVGAERRAACASCAASGWR